MAKASSSIISSAFLFLLLAITTQCANSARILNDVDQQQPFMFPDPINGPVFTPAEDPATTLPSGQFPAVAPVTTPLPNTEQPSPTNGDVEPIATSPPLIDDDVAPVPIAPTVVTVSPPQQPLPEIDDVAPVISPVIATSPTGPTATTTVEHHEHPGLSFFMHDILGGTQPSSRVVTGIIANSGVNGLPFSKSNGQVFPINGGVPLPNNINGIINNNHNIPFLTGFNSGSQTSTILQNGGNNNVINGGNSQPFVSGGQLPSGISLQQLMFGSVTVIDDELTEGHELGSAVIGRAQGFYLASSLDGTSQTIALTAICHGSGDHDHEHEEDTVSFFGVHRTASHESQIAIVGGTGKYENAKGYATIATVHMEDQHNTDGVDTILEINVYFSH